MGYASSMVDIHPMETNQSTHHKKTHLISKSHFTCYDCDSATSVSMFCSRYCKTGFDGDRNVRVSFKIIKKLK